MAEYTETMTLRVGIETKEYLVRVAYLENRKLGDILRLIIEDWIRKDQKDIHG